MGEYNFIRQSWKRTLFFVIVTLGAYLPWWFHKQNNALGNGKSNPLSTAFIAALYIVSAAAILFGFSISYTVGDTTGFMSTNYFYLGDISRYAQIVMFFFANDRVYKKIKRIYDFDMTMPFCLLLGPFYFQQWINKIDTNDNKAHNDTSSSKTASSDSVDKMVTYIKKHMKAGYTLEQLKTSLKKQGFDEKQVDFAAELATWD